jgi:hypothetical protein
MCAKTEAKEVTLYEHNKDMDVVALSGLKPERSRLRNNHFAVCIKISRSGSPTLRSD